MRRSSQGYYLHYPSIFKRVTDKRLWGLRDQERQGEPILGFLLMGTSILEHRVPQPTSTINFQIARGVVASQRPRVRATIGMWYLVPRTSLHTPTHQLHLGEEDSTKNLWMDMVQLQKRICLPEMVQLQPFPQAPRGRTEVRESAPQVPWLRWLPQLQCTHQWVIMVAAIQAVVLAAAVLQLFSWTIIRRQLTATTVTNLSNKCQVWLDYSKTILWRTQCSHYQLCIIITK